MVARFVVSRWAGSDHADSAAEDADAPEATVIKIPPRRLVTDFIPLKGARNLIEHKMNSGPQAKAIFPLGKGADLEMSFVMPPSNGLSGLGMLFGRSEQSGGLGLLSEASFRNALSPFGMPPPSFLGSARPPFQPPPSILGNALAPLETPPTSLLEWFHGHKYAPSPAPQIRRWSYVEARFGGLLTNLALTEKQVEDGTKAQGGVCECLNRAYWGYSSETANSLVIGSWGKGTPVRPPSDVDMLFLLPPKVYHQYEARRGNKQSQLLQELKNTLAAKYSRTTLRGDGQVVIISFDRITVEVSPGFRCQDGSIIVCDTNDVGRYIRSTSEAEIAELSRVDVACNGNARALARMMKQWRRERNVPLKSFHLERLAIEFLRSWPNNTMNRYWYDWMVRDFFAYLMTRANTWLVMPADGEFIWLGDEWLGHALTAYANALQACEHEYANNDQLAGEAWQKIFGAAIR